jgi:hypothetical protein
VHTCAVVNQHKLVPTSTANCVSKHKNSCDSRPRCFKYVTGALCGAWQFGGTQQGLRYRRSVQGLIQGSASCRDLPRDQERAGNYQEIRSVQGLTQGSGACRDLSRYIYIYIYITVIEFETQLVCSPLLTQAVSYSSTDGRRCGAIRLMKKSLSISISLDSELVHISSRTTSALQPYEINWRAASCPRAAGFRFLLPAPEELRRPMQTVPNELATVELIAYGDSDQVYR